VHVQEEKWIRVPDTKEAIISKAIFESVKEIRAD